MIINQLYGTDSFVKSLKWISQEIPTCRTERFITLSSNAWHSTLFYFAKLHNLGLISILPSMPRTSKWPLPLTFSDVYLLFI
jgi:hypothetical protein